MYIVLTQDVKKLGYKGDVVNVKRGYFVNFLYPQGVADFATASLIKRTADERKQRVMRLEELIQKAEEIKNTIAGSIVTITKKASAKGKLYGSVDESAVVEALAREHKIEIEPSQVKMLEHFKSVGQYPVTLALTDVVNVDITVDIVAEKE